MPYIREADRKDLVSPCPRLPDTPGELNFVLTYVIVTYMQHTGLDYQTINDILGALTGAREEFYRRVAVPYEDHKRDTNGDVYGPTEEVV